MKLRNTIILPSLWVLGAVGVLACGGVRPSATADEGSLKQAIGDRFLIGTALNVRQSSGRDTAALRVVKRHFNAIVAENCMKSAEIHPEEGRYHFDDADALVNLGEANGLTVTGHCLIWHSQLPRWFAVDKEGKPVSAEVLKARMKEHISTVVGRYKGRIKGWDVVNEAIVEDGSYRKTPFYDILGEEFIPLAFQYAHEADPDAELYYNDYGMDNPGRRDGVVRLVKQLKERGLRIDAVGMQGHLGMDYPDIHAFETSMMAFAATGVKVMITEWDMSALPTLTRSANISDISDTAAFRQALNPYPVALPDSVSQRWNARMKEFFNLFVKHSDVVTRVTAWGVTDGDSWKNNFPMPGRHDYALLFDRAYQPKPFVKEIITH
ncbi:MAG: endo-1,4-beta-xylanase [Mediterranea sp.]|jgi:endo-1,4-beta-xylanase|nr:endo-1,4-beta-xylanase [Mediterranea sp.]